MYIYTHSLLTDPWTHFGHFDNTYCPTHGWRDYNTCADNPTTEAHPSPRPPPACRVSYVAVAAVYLAFFSL